MVGTAAGRELENEHCALVAPGSIETVRERLPALEPQWVRVRLAYCGVCGSDRSYYAGERRRALPVSLGHEWVGTVQAAGSAVGFFAPGDVVTTDLNFRCGICRQCSSGRSHLCDKSQIGWFSNRGFARFTDIHASYLQKFATRSPAPHLALAEPLSCALHALSHVHLSPADRVLVVGAGGIGMCLAFLLWNESAVSFDVTDLDPLRLRRIGPVIDPQGRAIGAPTGEYDVVLDVSGSVGGLLVACETVARGGRLCTMSHLTSGTSAEFLLDLLVRKDVTFNLSYLNGEYSNLSRSIALLEQSWTPAWNLLLDVPALDALPDVFREGPAPSSIKVIIDLGGR
jgi:threonine dehydrogenase-like Zn-dependent dehydrogenase